MVTKVSCPHVILVKHPENLFFSLHKMTENINVKVLNKSRGNSSQVGECTTSEESSNGLIKELKVSMTSLKTNYMDEVSGMVDYVKMLKSSDFAVYRR